MLINFLNKGEILQASFHSDLHFETSHQLETELTNFHLRDDVSKVTIDFSKVRFVDSSGISLLLKWVHPMTKKVEVEFIHVNEPVQNILKICKLDQFATIKA